MDSKGIFLWLTDKLLSTHIHYRGPDVGGFGVVNGRVRGEGDSLFLIQFAFAQRVHAPTKIPRAFLGSSNLSGICKLINYFFYLFFIY